MNEAPGVLESSAYLLEFDSVHGRWHSDQVEVKDGAMVIDGKTVTYSMHTKVRALQRIAGSAAVQTVGPFPRLEYSTQGSRRVWKFLRLTGGLAEREHSRSDPVGPKATAQWLDRLTKTFQFFQTQPPEFHAARQWVMLLPTFVSIAGRPP